MRLRSILYLLSVCACFLFILGYQGAKAATVTVSYAGYKIDSPTLAWAVNDCQVAVTDTSVVIATLHADCHIRNGSVGIYAYPKVEWRSFGAKNIASIFTQTNQNYGVTGALKELRGSVFNDANTARNWSPKIIYSGDTSAVDIFQNVAIVSSTTVIGGITVNNDNKQQVQVYSRQINRIGSPPLIFALYDQYEGHLYLHAFKSRRTTSNHMEVIHSRLSPLHLGFLRGTEHGDNPFHKFYNTNKPYLFDGIDFSGAFTAAGQIARYLSAGLVVAYVPNINIDFFWEASQYAGGNDTDSVDVYPGIEPRWFYGIPQAIDNTDNGINTGFSSAICAGSVAIVNNCASKNLFPSYLSVLEASDFFQGTTSLTVIKQPEYIERNATNRGAVNQRFVTIPVGEIASFNNNALFGGGALGFSDILAKIQDTNISHNDISRAVGFNTGASPFFVGISTVDLAISNGEIDPATGFSVQSELLSLIALDMEDSINRGNIADSPLRGVLRLLKGDCDHALNESECADNDYLGAIPRADYFIPHTGGDAVAPLLSTEKGKEALQEALGL